MDKLNFDAEVTDVKWVTTTSGIVNPIIVLDKEYEAIKDDDSQKFDGIMILDINEVVSKGCGIGSKIKIKCNEQLVPMVADTTKTSDLFKFPTNCMYCNSDLQKFNGVYYCINHLCIAQGRTPIFKLVMATSMISLEREGVIDVHQYLNDFPYEGSTSKIEHIYPYLQMLHHLRNVIPTQARKDELVNRFGEKKGSGLWMFEFMILKGLERGLPPHEFWYVTGLPFTQSDSDKIIKFDVLKNKLDAKALKKIKLSEHGQQVVFNNSGLLNLIIPTMEKFIK